MPFCHAIFKDRCDEKKITIILDLEFHYIAQRDANNEEPNRKCT